jgi:hypothetical protein
MSSITVKPNEAIGSHEPAEKLNYLTVDHSIKSWLLTGDHKRIGLMYLGHVLLLAGIYCCRSYPTRAYFSNGKNVRERHL